MAHIRKRTLPSGKVRFEVAWRNTDGGRQFKLYATYREASDKYAEVLSSRPSSSAPVRALIEGFLAHYDMLVKSSQREKSTHQALKNHLNNHLLGDAEFAGYRCSDIGTPEIQLVLDRLLKKGVSPAMVGKIRTSLSQLFAYGARRGFVGVNPVTSSRVERSDRPEVGKEAAFILPPKEDLKRLLAAAASYDNTGQATALIRTLMFCGLRISELRGLQRAKVALKGDEPRISIVQRADMWNRIGPVKAKASRRVIDLGPETAQALRMWVMAAPKSEYLFPNEDGGVWGYQNLWTRFWIPLMNRAGLITNKPASDTARSYKSEYAELSQPAFGLHMLRHVYASLQIEQGVTPKRLQKLMGHATLKMTLDTYGHLWPDDDADRARARSVENAL